MRTRRAVRRGQALTEYIIVALAAFIVCYLVVQFTFVEALGVYYREIVHHLALPFP